MIEKKLTKTNKKKLFMFSFLILFMLYAKTFFNPKNLIFIGMQKPLKDSVEHCEIEDNKQMWSPIEVQSILAVILVSNRSNQYLHQINQAICLTYHWLKSQIQYLSGLVSLFNGISTLSGYLMPNQSM